MSWSSLEVTPQRLLRPWTRAGRILEASGGVLSQSHAMLPTPLLLDDRIRVYFASCDGDLRGRIFFADLARTWPHRVLTVEEKPVLDLGPRGTFDCDGVNPSMVFHHGGELLMIYIGWERDVDGAPYTLLGALAVSQDGGRTFERRKAPLLPRTPAERVFRTAPFLVRRGNEWELLYLAGSRFVPGDHRSYPIYNMARTRSTRLDAWPDEGEVMLTPDVTSGEIGFGRPVLWRETDGEETLMISRRTRTGYTLEQAPYRSIGQGRGLFQPVLAGAAEPWEADMTCFGAPLRVGDRDLLFYNGDRFGWTGFGLAWRDR